MPDTGSMIELFAASTGKRPLVLGKPMTATVDYITSMLSCDRSELAFIGDRLATDIAIGSKGEFPFPAGYYVYTGAARKNLAARLAKTKLKQKQ